jgi:hypothetical protein
MYGLKNTIDLSFLLTASVSQVVVSLSALSIDFDKPVRLTIYSTFAVGLSGQPMSQFNGSTEDAQALFPLIGDAISEAKATASGGLQVTFESGSVLEIFDDSEQYESFSIANGDQLIVV